MKILYSNKAITGLLIIFSIQVVGNSYNYDASLLCQNLKTQLALAQNQLEQQEESGVSCRTHFGNETVVRQQVCAKVRASKEAAWVNWSSNCGSNDN